MMPYVFSWKFDIIGTGIPVYNFMSITLIFNLNPFYLPRLSNSACSLGNCDDSSAERVAYQSGTSLRSR